MDLLNVLNYTLNRNQRFTIIKTIYHRIRISSIVTTSHNINILDNCTTNKKNNDKSKVIHSTNTGIRICKLLASQGRCSRREADEYIKKGYVLVDNKVCTVLGYRVLPHQIVSLSEEAKKLQNALKTIVLNKPIGYVSHADDDFKYPTAMELIQSSLYKFHNNNTNNTSINNNNNNNNTSILNFNGFAPAGRLDINSTGLRLLILTQDGRIAKQIINQDSSIDKEYIVKIDNNLNKQQLALLNYGLTLDDQQLKPCNVTWIKRDGISHSYILRMCELIGVKVLSLNRIRIGKIELEGLPVGSWRVLHSHETI